MSPRRGAGISRGRSEENVILLEEIHTLHTRMVTIETTQRRTPNEGVDSAKEESFEEEEEEDNETTRVIKMLAKVGGKAKMEIPMYEGSLNTEELMDWINSLDKYFDYEEETDDKKKVKFAVTRLKGHATIWQDELQTSRTRKESPRSSNGIKW